MIFIPLSASAWALVRRKEPSANKDGTVDRCRGTKTGDIYCPGVPWSRDGNMGLIDELQQRSRGRLPDGQISHSRVQPHLQKDFLFSPDPNHFTYYGRPVPPEGRLAIVTDAGRDAVDADVLLTRALKRTAKTCGPDAPTPASSLRKANFRKRRWQQSPIAEESTE